MHEDYIEILCKAWKLKPWDLIGVKGELEYRAGRNKDLTSSSKKQRKA